MLSKREQEQEDWALDREEGDENGVKQASLCDFASITNSTNQKARTRAKATRE